MSTQKIWDLHMRVPGPIDDNAAEGMRQLAESIADEPGVIWKIWTHESGSDRFGSTYLFKDIASLKVYKEMHMKRLEAFGVTDITDHVFDIMEDLSFINNAPIGSAQ